MIQEVTNVGAYCWVTGESPGQQVGCRVKSPADRLVLDYGGAIMRLIRYHLGQPRVIIG